MKVELSFQGEQTDLHLREQHNFFSSMQQYKKDNCTWKKQ